MNLKVGMRLFSPQPGAAVIVIRCDGAEVDLRCGGEAMLPLDEPASRSDTPATDPPASGCQTGKRYEDTALGLELLCTRGGAGELSVDGRPLLIKAPRQLPSSD
jgi:hypothetical protein